MWTQILQLIPPGMLITGILAVGFAIGIRSQDVEGTFHRQALREEMAKRRIRHAWIFFGIGATTLILGAIFQWLI